MDGIGSVLEKDELYTVVEFVSSEECEKSFPNDSAEWHKNGGRVEVKEYPGCYWYGRRFKAQ